MYIWSSNTGLTKLYCILQMTRDWNIGPQIRASSYGINVSSTPLWRKRSSLETSISSVRVSSGSMARRGGCFWEGWSPCTFIMVLVCGSRFWFRQSSIMLSIMCAHCSISSLSLWGAVVGSCGGTAFNRLRGNTWGDFRVAICHAIFGSWIASNSTIISASAVMAMPMRLIGWDTVVVLSIIAGFSGAGGLCCMGWSSAGSDIFYHPHSPWCRTNAFQHGDGDVGVS